MSEQHPGKAALKLLREYHAVFDFGHRGKADCADIASYVSDLESRLEKAEAERDARGSEVLDLQVQVLAARNDVLEYAAEVAEGPAVNWGDFVGGTPERDKIATAIRALKSPTPDQGGER